MIFLLFNKLIHSYVKPGRVIPFESTKNGVVILISYMEDSMKLLKTLIVMTILVSVSFSLYAGAEKEKGPVTITFMCTEADLTKDFVDQFNAENPDINLVRVEEDWTKWATEAMAGTASDLNRLGSGTDAAYYVNRGLFYDMTGLLKKSEIVSWDDIDKNGCSTYQYDGKVVGQGAYYGLPKDYNNGGMLTYNKEMFDAAGIPYLSETEPITYEELYELGKKLTVKNASGNVVTWGYDYDTWWTKFLVSDMATAQGLSLYNKDDSAMNEDPKVRDFWKYWARFQVENISTNVNNPNPGWTGSAFQSDRIAIVQLGYWFGAQLMDNENYNEKYGWAPTPILKKGSPRATNNLGATGVVMFSGTKHPEEAFRVFEWYMGGAYGKERAETGWGIPPLKSLAALLPENNKYNASRKAIAFDDTKYMVSWQASTYITEGMFDSAWVANMDDLVLGKISYDKFVDKFYAGVNESLKLGMEELGL